MLNLKNMGASAFRAYVQTKKLYIFGAGRLTENCVELYDCVGQTVAIVDNNEALWGSEKYFGDATFPVIGVPELCERIEKDRDVILLIVPLFGAAKIVEQLDEISMLDGLEAYLHPLIRNTREEIEDFTFSTGEEKIPRVIHYFWVGGKPLPKEFERYIATWSEQNPDFEIKRWDESNYDFSTIPYMKEAYEHKAWNAVTNVARLDVIYRYGGIYLDTDVEVLKSLDVLLCDDAFFGMSCMDHINTGVGFGTMSHHPMIKEMLAYYQKKHFIKASGQIDRVPDYYSQHEILKRYGISVRYGYQKKNGIVIYPPEVLSPKGTSGMGDFFSERTLTIHHAAGTWKKGTEKMSRERLCKLVKQRIV